MKIFFISVFTLMAIMAIAPAKAQTIGGTDVQKPSDLPQATATAKLVDKEKKAEMKAATVQVETSGIDIVDPDTTGEAAKDGQGHLHYRLDNGPIIATTAKKISFHELNPGSHTISIMLAGNDHKPISQEQTLTVEIK